MEANQVKVGMNRYVKFRFKERKPTYSSFIITTSYNIISINDILGKCIDVICL